MLAARDLPDDVGGGLDGPLRYLPHNEIAPAKPALEAAPQPMATKLDSLQMPHASRA